MSDPYVGEIRIVGFNFAPEDWALCDGSLLSIAQSEVLFDLIGTTYGGDGVNTFALPDLRGRTPVHFGTQQGFSYAMGQEGGVESETILTQQLPAHSHTIGAVHTDGASPSPAQAMFAASSAAQFVPVAAATGAMGNMVGTAGGGQPHENRQPLLVLNCIISLFGIFPSQ